MSDRLPRAMMTVAAAAIGPDDRGWARAMAVEYGEAERDGRAFGFAAGCLLAAWRRLPVTGSGRHLLLRYALALGLILPFAAFHLRCATTGLRYLVTGYDPYLIALSAGGERHRPVIEAYVAAAPLLTLLLAALGAAHVAVAYHVVGCRWRRAAVTMAVAVPVIAGLLVCIAAIHPSAKGMLLQVAALALEAAIVPILARLEARSRRRAES